MLLELFATWFPFSFGAALMLLGVCLAGLTRFFLVLEHRAIRRRVRLRQLQGLRS